MTRSRNLLAAVVAVGLVATVAAGAYAAGRGYVDAKGRIHGCVGKAGALSVVKAGKSCPRHTSKLVFDQRGPAGSMPKLTWHPFIQPKTPSCTSGQLCVTATSSWSNYEFGLANAAYAIGGDGTVHLRGLVEGASMSPTCDGGPASLILVLPKSERPTDIEIFLGSGDDGTKEAAAAIYVQPNGDVNCNDGGFPTAGKAFLSLSGIQFSAGG